MLTAWALKLPLWARDLQHAAREGELPYRDAINLCEDLLEGHPFARRALRSLSLSNSESGLVATAQHVAAAINMVVPELNLGAHHVWPFREQRVTVAQMCCGHMDRIKC